ncbi:ribonuclease G [Klebsiella pneumoniae]|uniref:Ribonuclease G n=1 Tax=Klebsiella pneumoniae TaxID=573 RepID=A0A3S4KH39_KLEPN|nr:ribonuclease G [Klebsiella pneumoniae]
MNNEDHRRRVLHSLEQALSKDRVKTSINGFSQLGLVEMTRKTHPGKRGACAVQRVPNLPRTWNGKVGGNGVL